MPSARIAALAQRWHAVAQWLHSAAQVEQAWMQEAYC